MLQINKNYFIATILLFIIEVLIALYVHDDIIRPYIGDVIVVILIYCFLKSFLKIRVMPLAFSVLGFSFLIETLQYFNFVAVIGLEHSALTRTVIGHSFAWMDIWCYVAGIVLVVVTEKLILKQQ